MASQPEHDEHAARDARDAAIAAAISNLVSIAIQVGIIVAVTKRDWLWRQAHRYRYLVTGGWRAARERRLLAELQRDLSRMDHEGIPGVGE